MFCIQYRPAKAGWQSGYAAACKAVYAGSIPASASSTSNFLFKIGYKMDKKISVIIRCKNEERWIGHTIQSVLDLVPNNEIIIIDDNSQDKSIEIVRQFESNPSLESNKGKYTDISIHSIESYSPGKAINMGVSEASHDSEYIMIISSHCILKNFDIQDNLQKLDENIAIFGNQIPIYRGQKITKRYLWSHFKDTSEVNMYSDSEERYFFHNALSLFKKSTLIENPFDENLVGKEDRYWANKIINKKIGDIFYNPLLSCDHHYTDKGNTWKGIG